MSDAKMLEAFFSSLQEDRVNASQCFNGVAERHLIDDTFSTAIILKAIRAASNQDLIVIALPEKHFDDECWWYNAKDIDAIFKTGRHRVVE